MNRYAAEVVMKQWLWKPSPAPLNTQIKCVWDTYTHVLLLSNVKSHWLSSLCIPLRSIIHSFDIYVTHNFFSHQSKTKHHHLQCKNKISSKMLRLSKSKQNGINSKSAVTLEFILPHRKSKVARLNELKSSMRAHTLNY